MSYKRKGVDGLTEQGRKWVAGVAKHGNPTRAAIEAGASQPAVMVHRMQRNPHALEAVNKLIMDALPDMGTLAIATITGIMRSRTAKDADKLRASGMVLDEIDRRRKTDGAFGKELHEMTGQELLAAMNRAQAKLEAIDAEIVEDDDVLG